MNTKKEIVLAEIMKVVPTKDKVEAIHFAQSNQTVYKVAYNAAEQVEALSRKKAVIAFNTFIDYLVKSELLRTTSLDERNEWVEQFKNDIKL